MGQLGTLLKPGNPNPLKNILSQLVGRMVQKREQNQYQDLVGDTTNQINQAYQGMPEDNITQDKEGDYQLGNFGASTTGNYRDARSQFANSMMNLIGQSNKFRTITPEQKQGSMSGLALLKQTLEPGAKQIKSYKPDENVFSIDEFGNSDLIQRGTQEDKKIGEYVGEDGYEYARFRKNDKSEYETKSQNKVRQNKGTTVNVNNQKSYGELLGDVNEGIQKIKNLKNAKFEQGKGYYIGNNDKGEPIHIGEQELQLQRNNIKSDYLSRAIQVSNEQGLDNAVSTIRQGIQSAVKRGYDQEKAISTAIDAFIKSNPQFNQEDKRILFDLFTLEGL